MNRRILLRVGDDECAILFEHKNAINRVSGEKKLSEVKEASFGQAEIGAYAASENLAFEGFKDKTYKRVEILNFNYC